MSQNGGFSTQKTSKVKAVLTHKMVAKNPTKTEATFLWQINPTCGKLIQHMANKSPANKSNPTVSKAGSAKIIWNFVRQALFLE